MSATLAKKECRGEILTRSILNLARTSSQLPRDLSSQCSAYRLETAA